VPAWDAELYLKFASERTQPAIDLLRRIELSEPRRILDAGCGPGNSTAELRRRWPSSNILGLDSSAEMIANAKQNYPDGNWIVADVRSWSTEEPFDLVFSNAMFQWLPDHAGACRHLLELVTPGGALAVQLPAHYDSPVHREMIDVSTDPAWTGRMEAARTALTKEHPEFYFDICQPVSSRVDLWETTYYHVLDGPEAILEWFRGTGLRPFLDALPAEDERVRFERMLLDRYKTSYPRRGGGQVLFPFKRLFFVAYRR
jgi:trans-aconitate 2-methyltransferase